MDGAVAVRLGGVRELHISSVCAPEGLSHENNRRLAAGGPTLDIRGKSPSVLGWVAKKFRGMGRDLTNHLPRIVVWAKFRLAGQHDLPTLRNRT